MSTPAAPPQQKPTTEQALLGAIVVVLGSGLPPAALIGHLLPLLSALGIPSAPGLQATSLVIGHAHPKLPSTPGPALAYTTATEAVRRAEYLVAVGRRFHDPAHSVEKERANLARHLSAQQSRTEAATKIDAFAARHGETLGWYAVRDDRTTPECRAAHGANFSALHPPKIGWPGTLHGGTCRCSAGRAHDSQLTVDEATAAVREHHVIPFAVNLSGP